MHACVSAANILYSSSSSPLLIERDGQVPEDDTGRRSSVGVLFPVSFGSRSILGLGGLRGSPFGGEELVHGRSPASDPRLELG